MTSLAILCRNAGHADFEKRWPGADACYGVSVRIEQMSDGIFRVNAGSLFVAFERLQRAGMIKGEWKTTENSRRQSITR